MHNQPLAVILVTTLDFFWEVKQNRNVNWKKKKDAEQEALKKAFLQRDVYFRGKQGEAQPAVFQEIIHLTQGEL